MKFFILTIFFNLSIFGYSQKNNFDSIFLQFSLNKDSFIKKTNESKIYILDTNNLEDKYFGRTRAKTKEKIIKYELIDSIEIIHFYTKKSGILYKEKNSNNLPLDLNCPNIKLILYFSDTVKMFRQKDIIYKEVITIIKSQIPKWKNIFESKSYIVVDEKTSISIFTNYSRTKKQKTYLEVQLTNCN